MDYFSHLPLTFANMNLAAQAKTALATQELIHVQNQAIRQQRAQLAAQEAQRQQLAQQQAMQAHRNATALRERITELDNLLGSKDAYIAKLERHVQTLQNEVARLHTLLDAPLEEIAQHSTAFAHRHRDLVAHAASMKFKGLVAWWMLLELNDAELRQFSLEEIQDLRELAEETILLNRSARATFNIAQHDDLMAWRDAFAHEFQAQREQRAALADNPTAPAASDITMDTAAKAAPAPRKRRSPSKIKPKQPNV
jgi:hypothetical protein